MIMIEQLESSKTAFYGDTRLVIREIRTYYALGKASICVVAWIKFLIKVYEKTLIN